MDFTDFEDLDYLDLKDALCDYNKELIEMILNDEDISLLIKKFAESGITNTKKFIYATACKEIIGPKVYVGDFDISDMINGLLMKDSRFSNLVKSYNDKLEYCLNNLSDIAKSDDKFSENVFKKYLSRLEKLYHWNGNDIKEFRTEVKGITKFKRDCEFRLTYKISSIDMKDKINACKNSREAFKLIYDTINDKSINDFDLDSIKEHFEIEVPSPREKLSYTKFLEDKLLFNYTSSTKYFNGKENIQNYRQIILYLALYIEVPIYENIERFFNINGLSLNAPAIFINDYSNLSLHQISYMLKNGFSKEALLTYLRRFSYIMQ